ncbi:hypothetical protein G7B40_005705 [Aetokthonos hydrillicola Thurmond2011]|jgi:hypothetical protein|uniref:Uncharacterized protein n=2 Tax=Aetokthonos TaxID=1550243 RepID=A0AAP5M3R2_9CYAN|nr:hypothetical protein [Aetokthonos hydrillicola Thurmond2011]
MVITEPIDYVSSAPNSLNSNIFSRSIYYYIVGSDGTITRTGTIKKFQVQYNIGAVKATYSISHASLLHKNAVWFIYNQDRDSKEKSQLNCVRIDFAGNKSEITPLKNQPGGHFYFQKEIVHNLGNALFVVGYHGGSIPTGYPEMFRIEIE